AHAPRVHESGGQLETPFVAWWPSEDELTEFQLHNRPYRTMHQLSNLVVLKRLVSKVAAAVVPFVAGLPPVRAHWYFDHVGDSAGALRGQEHGLDENALRRRLDVRLDHLLQPLAGRLPRIDPLAQLHRNVVRLFDTVYEQTAGGVRDTGNVFADLRLDPVDGMVARGSERIARLVVKCIALLGAALYEGKNVKLLPFRYWTHRTHPPCSFGATLEITAGVAASPTW